ncbi:GNAT family N-acetyltransferase [Lactobacillus gasseri]|jgi:acetyltransferase, GNAT family|uniref:N-acetyltransferase YjaB n=1 Tax=Lactobacillus gasseri TaxID=1596 RepID=A0ABY3BBZ0_LACGS|nr:GNAT family N-acetyltransferase [Lactobacillus gasseri]EEQ27088.1 acetyltransferase, GNAT family [Lactobacillus gasseri 202-4]KXA24417.1 acetyltransferase, GNAT family [Lactobacillus gasseri]MBW0439367.1 GNAT family N-acetyltransferase [Lactobacillus gasseri]MBW0440725.1 GNAT family N-acetyltransferase [Lactobacillus gasseri]MBW0452476.1 GNAT family N-acetyltransferase [Lactobacillus gasseri]
MKILKINALDQETENKLLVIWEISVRATHNFLSDPEINNIKKYVPHALRGVSHLIVAYDENEPIAFMGINDQKLEMLFVDANQRGNGIGKALITYGIDNLDINEQNPGARGFYEHMGFKAVERSEFDDQGNPYPILVMKGD